MGLAVDQVCSHFAGSSPAPTTNFGTVAQLAEHDAFNVAVDGSIPSGPTNFRKNGRVV